MAGYDKFQEFIDRTGQIKGGIQSTDRYDRGWKVTLTFYSAVHRINHFLTETEPDSYPGNSICIRISSHEQRNDLVKNHPHLGKIYRKYFSLYKKSKRARYNPSDKIEPLDEKEAEDELNAITEFTKLS